MLCREQPQGSFGVVLGCRIFAIIIIFVVHPADAAATTTTALMIMFVVVNSVIILGAMDPEFQRLLRHEEGRRVASHRTPFFVCSHCRVDFLCAQFLLIGRYRTDSYVNNTPTTYLVGEPSQSKERARQEVDKEVGATATR